MKIVHLCVSNFFIDGFAYQENELVRQNVLDGHDVLVIASTETYSQDMDLTYVKPCSYVGTEGARVIRVPYRRWLPQRIMRKLRIHPNILSLLEKESPDVILFHSLCGWELLTAKAYKKKNPAVRMFADSHEDFNNSARSFISRNILHRFYYRSLLRYTMDAFEKILCISIDTIHFVRDFYGVPAEKIEFYPLGGFVFDDSEYARIRSSTRSQYQLCDRHILFIQTGKMDASKKVLQTLKIFTRINNSNIRLFLVGHLQRDVAAEAEAVIRKDSRIQFVGWKSPNDLRNLLCAADVYVQPGTQSATMQMSLCCRCVVILDDVPSHKPYINGNGWLVGEHCTMEEALLSAVADPERLPHMSSDSTAIAARLLDYRKLASRLYA